MSDNTVTIKVGPDAIATAPPVKEPVMEVQVDTEIKDEKQARKFFEGMADFIKNGSMEQKAKDISKRTGLPSKEVSKKFFLRILGIIGSTAEIAVNTVGDLASAVINLIGRILLEGVDLIIRLAQRLVRVVTLNQGITA